VRALSSNPNTVGKKKMARVIKGGDMGLGWEDT
jgi:hypothetical protein